MCHFHLNIIAMHPHPFNRFFYALFPLSGSFHTDLDKLMLIKNISDLKVRGGGGTLSWSTWTPHAFTFWKLPIYCLNTAWINL